LKCYLGIDLLVCVPSFAQALLICRPLSGLVRLDPAGHTAKALTVAGINTIAALESDAAIYIPQWGFDLRVKRPERVYGLRSGHRRSFTQRPHGGVGAIVNRLVETGQ